MDNNASLQYGSKILTGLRELSNLESMLSMHSHRVGATAGEVWAKAEKRHPYVLISSPLAWATTAI